MRWLITTIVFSVTIAHAQNDSIFFYRIIKDDSVKLFLNSNMQFTNERCATLFRYTRVDLKGNFNGDFVDISTDENLVGAGHYAHGLRHGYFQEFYANGKVMSQGKYENNRPSGKWEFFYENGLPQKTIIISPSGDTLLWTQIDPKGRINVLEGEGKYIAYKEFRSKFENYYEAKGEVRKGKPHGLWTAPFQSSFADGRVFTHEEFYENGSMIRTTYPAQHGSARPRLNQFFPRSYLNEIEQYRFKPCDDSIKHIMRTKHDFEHTINSSITKIVNRRNESVNAGDYKPGKNICVIMYRINEKGRPTDFSLLSEFGKDFLQPIAGIIKDFTSYRVNDVTIYTSILIDIKTDGMTQYNGRNYLGEVKFFTNRKSVDKWIHSFGGSVVENSK